MTVFMNQRQCITLIHSTRLSLFLSYRLCIKAVAPNEFNQYIPGESLESYGIVALCWKIVDENGSQIGYTRWLM